MYISKRLKELRTVSGFSQEKLAEPWTVTTTLLPNIFGSHVKKAGLSASGAQQQFYEAGDKLMDSHCFLLFFAISSKLLKKLCQFCAAGAKSSAF